ncbi:MAG: hypothetical protein K6F27_02595 [Ruminococcus sp.]|nr:hypothetical protein [Ruminococcus sp.]
MTGRPKAVQFIGNYYNSEEIKQLLDCTKEDPLHMVLLSSDLLLSPQAHNIHI